MMGTEFDSMTEIQIARLFEGKKFLWDGEQYEDEEKADANATGYREKGFEVQRVTDGGKVLLYTRRSVSST
jgi:hypothetical protein